MINLAQGWEAYGQFFIASGEFTWPICPSPEVNLDLVPVILDAVLLKTYLEGIEISLETKDENKLILLISAKYI